MEPSTGTPTGSMTADAPAPAAPIAAPPKVQSSGMKVAPSAAPPHAPEPTTPDIAGTVQGAQALYSQWQNTNKELEETLRHTPKFEQTNPIEALSSWAGILGLFGGALMRDPAMGMLAAAKGVLEGQKANDLDKYNKAMQEFQMHRDYLSQVSGNLAKQIQLIQQNQHYTNQEKIAHERLLLQAMGVNQRGANMLAAANRYKETLARQDAQHAFTDSVKWLDKYDLPPEQYNAAINALMEAKSAGKLTSDVAREIVNQTVPGASLKRGPSAIATQAQHGQELLAHFKPGGNASDLTINNVTYTQDDFNQAMDSSTVTQLLKPKAKFIRDMIGATTKVPSTTQAPMRTREVAREELSPEGANTLGDWSAVEIR